MKVLFRQDGGENAHSIGMLITYGSFRLADLGDLFWNQGHDPACPNNKLGGFAGRGLICVALAILLYVFMEDRPQTLGLPPVAVWKNDHIAKPAEGAEKPKSTWQMQLSILKYPSIWVLAVSTRS